MQSSDHPEEGRLAESSYEFVTSHESVDDTGTESMSEADFPTPDDVQSLADTDRPSAFGEESEDEDEEDDDPPTARTSMQYTEKALGHPSSHQKTYGLGRGEPSSTRTPLSQSIELQEEKQSGQDAWFDRVVARHTLRELTEAEAAAFIREAGQAHAPRRLVASVRQTMSTGHLSTREPLRMLYVGDMAGAEDIIHKISSALPASALMDGSGGAVHGHNDGMFSVLPISDFGSSKAPEVDLMPTSGYHIKVELCTAAEEIINDAPASSAVYSVTVDQGAKYCSTVSAQGPIVEPKWSLPHIAIFYATNHDDKMEDKKRAAVWEFMARHGVPSIVIAQEQSLTGPQTSRWREFVNPEAVHLCIESGDPESSILVERLPIDLATFLTIDARQMNRNLAHLTGLEEARFSAESAAESRLKTGKCQELEELRHLVLLETTRKVARKNMNRLRDSARKAEWFEPAVAFSIAFTVPILLAVLYYWATVYIAQVTSQPEVVPTSISSISTPSPTSTVATSTATVTINFTSTKTVEIARVRPTTSTVSLQPPFVGLLSDKAQSVVPEPAAKTTICRAEVYSDNEILIRVPSGNKAVWLSKGAIDIDIARGSEVVKSKLFSVDEGIMVEIAKGDAYGVLNVSVITSRKPKINETFVVDFGKPLWMEVQEATLDWLYRMSERLVCTVEDGRRLAEHTYGPAIASLAEKFREDVDSLSEAIKDAGKSAREYSSRVGAEALARLEASLKPEVLSNIMHEIRDDLGQQLRALQEVRDKADISLLRAQIASKLWWLKIQGTKDAYAEYEQKATRFLKKKIAAQQKGRHSQCDDTSETPYLWKRRGCSCGHHGKQERLQKRWAGAAGRLWKLLG